MSPDWKKLLFSRQVWAERFDEYGERMMIWESLLGVLMFTVIDLHFYLERGSIPVALLPITFLTALLAIYVLSRPPRRPTKPPARDRGPLG